MRAECGIALCVRDLCYPRKHGFRSRQVRVKRALVRVKRALVRVKRALVSKYVSKDP
jgi:hypothetical protein